MISKKLSAALAMTTIATVVGFSWSKSLSQLNTLAPVSKYALTTQLTKTLTGQLAWIYAIAISPDSKTLASGSEDETIKIWQVSSKAAIAPLASEQLPRNLTKVGQRHRIFS